ncbi:hypothetical protein Enr17x_24980 [Gimesia fumaroli]|uniref:Uncharacterized protein n=1 Tax=Gimesia fumaroli TaxID=2527976 RepID=A0A518IBH3_9PLAN|nr:hypothetical protein Enr17x_24980 [Gimesia fumaroli]
MKAATRNRLRIAYLIFAPAFLVLCLAAIFIVVFFSDNAICAAPLYLPTLIAFWSMRRCTNWLN